MATIYYDGAKWGVKDIKGEGQIHCDGSIMAPIEQLCSVYGLIVDADHPLYFDPEKSDKWLMIVLPHKDGHLSQ